MPSKYQSKKGYTNIKNEDNKCFTWSILAHLHPIHHNDERVTNDTPFENELDMSGISNPVSIKDITKFEKQNPSISVNVFGLSESLNVYPLRISKEIKKNHVRLLYISNERNNHYILIKNVLALVCDKINKDRHHKWICDNCLNPFYTEK